MEKISSQRVRCVVMGCSNIAEEGSDPPMCSAHMREKRASVGTSFGVRALSEDAYNPWKEENAEDVHE